MVKNSKLQVVLDNKEEKEVRETVKNKHTTLSNFIREAIFEKIRRESN